MNGTEVDIVAVFVGGSEVFALVRFVFAADIVVTYISRKM